MNIQYIKTNIENMSQNELVSLLADVILDNVKRIQDFSETVTYNIGDRVYFEESGIHCVYQCILNKTSGKFDRSRWIPLVEVYSGPSPTFYTLKIMEEVHIPSGSPTKNHTISLNYNVEQSTVAIYRGKHRMLRDIEFTVSGKNITFTDSIPVGERIIIEVRERLGMIPNIIAGIVLYDIKNEPYNVLIDDDGKISVNKIEKKDDLRDIKRTTLIYGDKRYTLMVDSGVNPPALGLFEEVKQNIKTTTGKIYSVEVTGNKMTLVEEPYLTDGVSYIMGTDKNFYNFNVVNGVLSAIKITSSSLLSEDHNIGLRLKSTEFKDKMIDVRNGTIRLIDYSPNIAYSNILLRSKGNDVVYRVTLNNELGLEMHDDTNGVGTHSPIMDTLYFYNYDLATWKLYIDNDRLIYETCPETVVKESRGINMINSDGVLSKVIVIENEKIDTIKFADFSKMGTFASPLDNGLVVMDGSTKKIITVDLNGDKFIVKNASGDMIYKTNDHYIMGSDNKLYKFTFEAGNVGVTLCDPNDFVMENKRSKLIVKSNEVINVVDVTNGSINIKPVSTFTHTLKSEDGRKYIMTVIGPRGKEVVYVKEITSTHPYFNTVGLGCIYLKSSNGLYYKGIVKDAVLTFYQVEFDPMIDYDIASVANTEQGWFKFEMNGTVMTIRKIFNNLYFPSLCYEISREFVLSSENDKDFSLSTNGNGELVIKPAGGVDIPGIYFRSSDDKVYCVGVVNNSLTTYRSFIEKEVKIEKTVHMKDIVTGKYHVLYMVEDKLVIEPIAMATSNSENELYVYNNYNDRFIIVLANSELIIIEDIIDRAIDESGGRYIMNVERRKLKFVKDDSIGDNSGYIKLTDMVTGDHYLGYVENNLLKFKVSETPHNTPNQAVRADGLIYILSMFEGRVSMTLIKEDKTYSEYEEYVPIMLDSHKIYDNIRVYDNIINTEGYVMYNAFDLDLSTGDMIDVDLSSNRYAYKLPVVTKNKPKANVIDIPIEGMEE